MPNIYDPNPRERLKSARAVAAQTESSVAWPPYWTGVSNAWLVFLGPSPGNSPGKVVAEGGIRTPTLGLPHPHVATYEDSNGFWPRIRQWTHQAFSLSGVFTEPKDSLSLVLVGNILSANQGDAGKLPLTELLSAIPGAAQALLRMQPRLVVTMDKRISGPLVKSLVEAGMSQVNSRIQTVPARNQLYVAYKPKSWDLMHPSFNMRVVESPQHPTKVNFYDSAVVDEFLAQHVRDLIAS